MNEGENVVTAFSFFILNIFQNQKINPFNLKNLRKGMDCYYL